MSAHRPRATGRGFSLTNKALQTFVLEDIVVNAVQAMQGDGTLTALLRRRESLIEVTISDTGEGISPEHLGKIFEPYFSTKQTRPRGREEGC